MRRSGLRRGLSGALAAALAAGLILGAPTGGYALDVVTVERVSVRTMLGGNFESVGPAISADGRYVAFTSPATNLVAGDTNGQDDVFVYDRQTGVTERVSVATDGAEADGGSSWGSFGRPAISADGRYVAFASDAANLVPGDTNGQGDVFVRDRQSGTTERVSVAAGGAQADGRSTIPAISADGRYVAFTSGAADLVPGDTNGQGDVFVRDRQSGTTERVSVASDGAEGNDVSFFSAVSADGRYVAFTSVATNLVAGDTEGFADVFVRDRVGSVTERVSVATDGTEGDGDSGALDPPAISADGSYVAFSSRATNLVAGGTSNEYDVFVRDRVGSVTERVSVATDGAEGNGPGFAPAISADGRYVAFTSPATNLVAGDTNGQDDVFVYDRQTGVTERVSVATGGAQGNSHSYAVYAPVLSADGRYVAFTSGATNLVTGTGVAYGSSANIFVRDRVGGATELAIVGSSEADADSFSPAVSADGRYVAFASFAHLVVGDTNDRIDVFVYDRQAGVTARVSVSTDGDEGDNHSSAPAISADGRYVAFESQATILVAGDTNGFMDVFVRDRQTGTTERVSVATGGAQGNHISYDPAISADGRYVAFSSVATNLVAGDTNAAEDIFVHDRQTGTTERVSAAIGGGDGNGGSYGPLAVSADGRYVAFTSSSTNLVAGSTSGSGDIFVRDRQSGTTQLVSVAMGGGAADGVSGSSRPGISADGRYVTFWSDATNLVAGDTNDGFDVFLRDRQAGTTGRVSVATGGGEADGTGGMGLGGPPRISADGRYVAFASDSANLVPGDTNGVSDVFLRDRQAGTTERLSAASGGAQGNGRSVDPAISGSAADGFFVAYSSNATNLVAGDTNGFADIFVVDLSVPPPAPSPSPSPSPAPAPPDPPAPPEVLPGGGGGGGPQPSGPLVVEGRPVILPPSGVVTRDVRLVGSGGVTLVIPAGTTATLGGVPVAVTIDPPAVTVVDGVPTYRITTSLGDDVVFSPPIAIVLTTTAAASSVRAQASPEPDLVPVQVLPGGGIACPSWAATADGVRVLATRPGTYELRGPARPAVARVAAAPVLVAPGLHAGWAGQSASAVVCPGQQADLTVLLANTGTASWVHGAAQVNLGSSAPPGNTRDADAGVLARPLFNRDRFATTAEAHVQPGALGTFSFRLRAPASAGSYRVYVRPVVEGVAWLEDEGIYLELVVR